MPKDTRMLLGTACICGLPLEDFDFSEMRDIVSNVRNTIGPITTQQESQISCLPRCRQREARAGFTEARVSEFRVD